MTGFAHEKNYWTERKTHARAYTQASTHTLPKTSTIHSKKMKEKAKFLHHRSQHHSARRNRYIKCALHKKDIIQFSKMTSKVGCECRILFGRVLAHCFEFD